MKSFLEQYMPQSLDELILPKQFIDILKESINKQQLYLLLQGYEGKTTLIHCILKYYYETFQFKMNYKDWIEKHVLEINHLNENLNKWRQHITSFIKIYTSKPKCIIIDGIDTLPETFQYILYNILETYRSNVFFICTCIEKEHIQQSLLYSLNHCFIPKIQTKHIKQLCMKIINEQNIFIKENVLNHILKHSIDLKQIILILEKIKLIDSYDYTIEDLMLNIKHKDLYTYTNDCVYNANKKSIYDMTQTLYSYYEQGYSVIDILEEYYNYIQWTDDIETEIKYRIIKYIMKYISIFHTNHEHSIELYFLTYDVYKEFHQE